MLRPATPLTITLLISFVFLLLSTISTPIIKGIPIGAFQDVNFGVFGYCRGSDCSGFRLGYTTDGLFPDNNDGDWSLPAGTRNNLSSILIVHPIATLLNLVCLGLAAAGHLHSPSHSARYLLGLFILLLPTFLITLLAFLVDILLFVPHVQWGGWIVLGSVILVAISGIITCAMRRTLVSRKARKKRIAENAEMSGENFYARQAQEAKLPSAPTFSTTETKSPIVNGGPGADNLPAFAIFDPDRRDDDRQPFAPQGASSMSPTAVASRDDASSRYYNQPSRSNSRPPPTDQFGNPLPRGEGPGSFEPMPGRSPSDRGPPGSGPGPYRENGMPPPRGGFGSRGRGGPPPRGGYPPRGGFGLRGPPPQGYGRGGYPSRGRGGYPPPGVMAGAAGGAMMAGAMNRGPQQPPPGYGPPRSASREGYARSASREGYARSASRDGYGPPDDAHVRSPSVYSAHRSEHGAYGARAKSPSAYGARAQSPGAYGAIPQSPGRSRAGSYGSRTQSPAGGYRQPSPPPAMPPLPVGPAEMDTRYPSPPAQQGYVPPRANWDNDQSGPLPLAYHAVTAELPTSNSLHGSRRQRVNSGGSDVYYEDVDPRFVSDPEPMPNGPPGGHPVPQLLTPGGRVYHDESPDSFRDQPLPMTHSYEDLPGARSPAESEDTNFTSVSQRGINPNWRPGSGGEFNSLAPMRRPVPAQVQARRDVLLAGNPDFEIPGMGPPTSRGARSGFRGGFRGGGMGSGPGRMPPPGMALTADGPYPRGPPMGGGGDVREI